MCVREIEERVCVREREREREIEINTDQEGKTKIVQRGRERERGKGKETYCQKEVYNKTDRERKKMICTA